MTKTEILAGLSRYEDGHDPCADALCDAVDWLESIDGGDYPGSYTSESIREAVEAEDPSLLRRC